MAQFDYHTHRQRTWRDYTVYIRRLRGKPSPLLDMGSGIGLLLEAAKNFGLDAVGLEYEQEGVDETLRKGLIAYQQDLSKPIDRFDDATFGAIICNQVIEHLNPESQSNLINEAFRLLKPGGQFLIMSPCRHFEPARLDPYHIGLLTPSELKAMLQNAGFERLNMGYNRPQKFNDIPEQETSRLWEKFQPDVLSQTATALAFKPAK